MLEKKRRARRTVTEKEDTQGDRGEGNRVSYEGKKEKLVLRGKREKVKASDISGRSSAGLLRQKGE